MQSYDLFFNYPDNTIHLVAVDLDQICTHVKPADIEIGFDQFQLSEKANQNMSPESVKYPVNFHHFSSPISLSLAIPTVSK